MIKSLKRVFRTFVKRPLHIIKNQNGQILIPKSRQDSQASCHSIHQGHHWPHWQAELTDEELYTLIERNSTTALPSDFFY